MSETKNGTVVPVHRAARTRGQPTNTDLHREYQEMVSHLLRVPLSVPHYSALLERILHPLKDTKGELVILGNGTKIYFAYEGKPFTDFGAVPLAVVQAHYEDRVQYDIKLLVLSSNVAPRIIQIEYKHLGSKQWIDDLGVYYFCEKWGPERLRALIQMMALYAPVQDDYQYSGWSPDGENFYIMNGGRLCGADWDVNRAKNSCEHTLKMLDVASHHVTMPLLSIAALSLVQSKMVGRGLYFKGVCCLVAPTQSFKTTLAALLFDYQNGMEADVNFESTMAAIIRTVGNKRDSTVIVDDYKPGATKAENNEMLLKISRIIRMCSDNSGGMQKAGAQDSVIANVAQSLVVVTAERIHFNVQSTVARLLILEMTRKSVNIDKLTFFQENHSAYREFTRQYIMYISNQGVENYCDNLTKKFLEQRNVLRNKLIEENDVMVDNRTNDLCVWLYISFSDILEYSLDVNAINQEQFDQYKRESLKIFLFLMKSQSERVAELDETKQFFRALQVLLETREVHIGELQARNTSYSTAESKKAIGFRKKGYVYLKNGVAFIQVVSFYQRYGKEFAVSETTLRKALADKGYLVPKDEKSFIHRLFVNNETYQCVKISEVKFYEILNGGKNNGSESNREVPGNWGVWKNAENFLGRGD